MRDRENLIGVVLLVLCAIVAGVLVYTIATGNRFRFTGPSWLGNALIVLFIVAAVWGFLSRPGRRWPWQRDRDGDRDRDLP
jgi:hypothetical protein